MTVSLSVKASHDLSLTGRQVCPYGKKPEQQCEISSQVSLQVCNFQIRFRIPEIAGEPSKLKTYTLTYV
jgi:hypothetical protein